MGWYVLLNGLCSDRYWDGAGRDGSVRTGVYGESMYVWRHVYVVRRDRGKGQGLLGIR